MPHAPHHEQYSLPVPCARPKLSVQYSTLPECPALLPRGQSYSMIGITLSVPIFSGGSKFYKVKQTKVSIDQLNLQRDDTKRNLQLAVKQYIDNMNTCIKKFDAAQKGVEQAERGYMISQKRYDTGAGTWLEMNDAELALTQARLNFNQSIYDYMVAKADLEKVLGNGQMN